MTIKIKIYTKEIRTCLDCPDCINNYGTIKHCNKKGHPIPDDDFLKDKIPLWCPLPDAPKKERKE